MLCFLLYYTTCVAALQATIIPPLIDVPTYSLATLDDMGKTNMNIVTYVTPVSITPDRLWCVGIVKSSLSHANFISQKSGILQLLRPQHSNLVKLLGGSSGADVDKQRECEELGFEWQSLGENEDGFSSPLILPDCAHYLFLKFIDVVDGGSHDVFICKVENMWTTSSATDDESDDQDSYLSTRRLRKLGIITNQGRVAQKPE